MGIVAQRSGTSYRRLLPWKHDTACAGVTALYLPLHLGAASKAGAALLAQIGFRSAYALVNVLYAAWRARISDNSDDRATLAGFRMLFGALAAVLISLGTSRIGLRLTGDTTGDIGSPRRCDPVRSGCDADHAEPSADRAQHSAPRRRKCAVAARLLAYASVQPRLHHTQSRGGVGRHGGLRAEDGLAAAAGVLGSAYARIGYAPGGPQTAATLARIRWLMLGAPALGPAAAALADASQCYAARLHASILARLTAGDHGADG